MKKRLQFALFLPLLLLLVSLEKSSAQGCVAIRQMGGCASTSGSGLLSKGQFQAGLNYRYFRSYKHFRGDSEQKERVEQGTEVINLVHAVDLGISYGFSDRLSATLTLPYIHYDRSSLYEHYGNSEAQNPEHKRFHTGASGLGDIRLSGNYWLLNPATHLRSNVSVGLGVKFPSGNANVQDEFHKRKATDGTDSIVVKAVDQSIQLGDGGFGISLETQAFTTIFNNGALYFSGFYMSNPRETNNTVNRVLTSKSTARDSITAFHSSADQFVARLGVNYAFLPSQGLAVNLGGRIEGIPAKDVIGGSNGFRRPGYIVSAEPGLSYQHGAISLNLQVPVALYRNRVKSVSDLADPTGQAHGDAAFADYSINFGFAYRFGGHHSAPMIEAPKFKDAKN